MHFWRTKIFDLGLYSEINRPLPFQPDIATEEEFIWTLKDYCKVNPVDAVCLNMEYSLNYIQYMRAHQFLVRNPKCLLIIGMVNKTVTFGTDIEYIGPGSLVPLLWNHSPAIVLGKPGAALGQHLIDKFNVRDPKRVLFIGDSLEEDISFGNRCGFQTMLVLTGMTKREDVMRQKDEKSIPDYVAESIFDFEEIVGDEEGYINAE